MVVITDGDIFGDPLNLMTVISSPKMQGIERFAIGVRARSWQKCHLTPCSLGWGGARDPDKGFWFSIILCKQFTQTSLY